MELLIKINTGETLTLAEAAQLAEAARRDRVPLNQLATDYIRQGLQRRRGWGRKKVMGEKVTGQESGVMGEEPDSAASPMTHDP